MEHKYLHEVLPFLEEVDRERREQFEAYFRTAPLWILDSLQVETLPPGVVFVRENEPANMVYFVGTGIVKATDYRISGVAYDFMKPSNMIALGGMEVIMELSEYQTTLQTETECTIVKVPRAKFERWIYSDVEAFRLEVKITSQSLLDEVRRNRLYLFLQGADRLSLLLVDLYEKYNKGGSLRIKESRQNLADETGICLKSVSRAVKKLAQDQLITKDGNQILVNEKQYENLKRIVNEKIDRV